MNTQSEKWFEGYCADSGIPYERISWEPHAQEDHRFFCSDQGSDARHLSEHCDVWIGADAHSCPERSFS